jgi:hypothetical protein
MAITTAHSQGFLMTLAVMACLTASSGCTSVIGSAYLREAWLDAVEHAAETTSTAGESAEENEPGRVGRASDGKSRDDADQMTDTDAESVGSRDPADVSTVAVWSPATLDEAVAEAERALSQSGGLSEAARGTLIAMLKSTPRQDWLVVIEEFTAALAAAHADNGMPLGEAATAEKSPAQPSAQPDNVLVTAAEQDPVPSAAAAEPVAPLPPATVAEPTVAESEKQPAPADRPPVFAVQNACFASRVRAWGVVDRFETSQFDAGQELIVYFELDQLSSRESPDGHTTRVDAVLRLVGEDGRRIHEWTFEPLEETCRGHRRDYFARYLVELPATIDPGHCRLEVVASDMIAGRTAHASLPMEIGPR